MLPYYYQPTTLTPDIFFLYLLPPIIMEAGYFMPNRYGGHRYFLDIIFQTIEQCGTSDRGSFFSLWHQSINVCPGYFLTNWERFC
jgi:hypothetical protein